MTERISHQLRLPQLLGRLARHLWLVALLTALYVILVASGLLNYLPQMVRSVLIRVFGA